MSEKIIPGTPGAADFDLGEPVGVFARPSGDRVNFFDGAQGATPKYARNQGEIADDFRETMARFFINSTKKSIRLEGLSPEMARLAEQIYNNGYIDFILQNVQTGLSEKVDLSENLSGGYVAYYLGTSPQVLQCSGVLLNTLQDDQVVSMVELYAAFLSGTKLAEHGETLRFRYDSFLYTGYLNNLQWSLAAENELYCPFSFTFLKKTRRTIPSPYFRAVPLASAPDITGDADVVGPMLVPQKTVAYSKTVVPPTGSVSGPPPDSAALLADRDRIAALMSVSVAGETVSLPNVVAGEAPATARE